MGGILDKGGGSRITEEIEVILNDLQERMKGRNNCLTRKGVRMVTYFMYESFKEIKD